MNATMKYTSLPQSEESELAFNASHVPQSPSAKPAIIWRGINLFMSVFFLLAALVQVNDPDPYVWIPAYILPAIYSLAITFRPQVTTETWWRVLVVIHIALCLSGCLYLTGVVFDLLSKDITNPLIHEEGRELGGLIVILVWLSLCRFTKLGNNDPTKGTLNALLLVTAVMGLMPLAFWGLCFVSGLSDQLSHCKDMFDGGILAGHRSN